MLVMKGLGLEEERVQGQMLLGRQSGRSVAGLWGAGLRLCICHNEKATWG